MSFLRAVISVAKRVRERNPDIVYYCDPVLGDHGRLYVPAELVEVYRDEVVPLATVLTPNQFEIEQLTGLQITDEDQAWKACDILHGRGVQTVVITSCYLGVVDEVSLLASHRNKIGSSEFPNAKALKQGSRYVVNIPLIDGRYSGTGDLVAALLLAWSSRCGDDLSRALELSCATVHAVIRRTFESIQKGENPHRELRLIQSAADILTPPVENLPFKLKVICRD